jgi:four helix bundle protein
MSESEIKSYRDLRVWQAAMDLAEACYVETRKFPRDEMLGLSSQIRRAAASIPANIAEGNGRELTLPYVQSLRIAQGSLKELETHVLLAFRVGILSDEVVPTLLAQCEDVGKMLRSLIRSLQSRVAKG